MAEVLAWPVVRREAIVRAVAPGELPSRESPFRALRTKGWASEGMDIRRHRGGRLAGRLVVYCSLNVDAARLARLGDGVAAARVADAARCVETGTGFGRLRELLRALGDDQLQAVLDGQLPTGESSVEIKVVLGALAQEIARISATLPRPYDTFAGEVSERRKDSVLVTAQDGTRMAVPLWLAQAAHRDQLGDRLVLISVRLDDYQALVQVVPGIDIPAPRSSDEPIEGFSPFGRGSRRLLEVSGNDLDRLRGMPLPLRVLVPVTVEG